jgi:hypothetical protein
MKTYRVGTKPKKDEIQIAQGERSRRLELENQQFICMTAGENYTFFQLQKATGLCRQSLMKHLRELEKRGLIFKDIVKPWERLNDLGIIRNPLQAWAFRSFQDHLSRNGNALVVKPQRVGQVVYRIMSMRQF